MFKLVQEFPWYLFLDDIAECVAFSQDENSTVSIHSVGDHRFNSQRSIGVDRSVYMDHDSRSKCEAEFDLDMRAMRIREESSADTYELELLV